MSIDMELVADDMQEHVHDVEPHEAEPDEIHMPPPSIAPITLGFGAALFLLGIIFPPLLVVGLVVTVGGIWKMAHFPEVDLHPNWLTFLNDRKLGMWIFLASEVMFFSALIGAFIAFKIQEGFEEAHAVLNLPLATVGTSVLIVSSFAVVMGLEAIQSDDRRVFRNWMLVTLVLGLLFVSIQAVEWYELFDHGIDETTLFGTTFYVTTGFHGLHVLGGVGWLALLLLKARRGEYSAQNNLGVELFGLYWHFVDVVWIVLFTVIYLIH
jgi:heme/copper-type cytochrome/quinol oxidase subunit 3